MEELKKYVMYLKPYIGLEVIISFIGLMSSIIALINPVLLQIVIDKVLVESQLYLLKYIVLVFAFFFILSCLISYANGYIGTYINQGIIKTLKMDVFTHIENIQLSDKQELASGDFITKINDDTTTVATYITSTFVAIISYVTNIGATGILMLSINKNLAAVMFAVTIVELVISVKFTDLVRENQRAVKYTYSENMNFLNHFFSGFKNIKAYNREKDMKRKYVGILERLIHLNFRGFHITYSYEMALSFASFIGSCFVYGMGIYFIVKGNMTIGALFVFDIIAERFNTFATGIVNFNVDLQSVLVCIERLESLLSLKRVEDVDGKVSGWENTSITFDDVSFAYSEEEVLKHINLKLESGNVYALVGDSGCGKSTMIDLLTKFYSPTDGIIKVNDTDLQQISASHIRDNIIVVFQDSILNDGTIEENIRYGDSEATMERIEKVARLCEIQSFIEGLPDRYQTNIGEIGDKISGGQKQRLCLARALLRNGEVYIFDEAFCNMDKILEDKVYRNIVNEYKNKLIIMISHNIKLVSKIPNIVILKDGAVEATGDHIMLMECSEIYKQLYNRGGKEFE